MPSLYSFRRLAGLVVATSCAAAGFGLVLRAQIPQGVNTWTSRGAIPQARTGAAAAVLADGRTVIAGGLTADGVATNSVVVFNPLTNEVSRLGFSGGGS